MAQEVNYKKNFCLKYFGKNGWDLDVLHEVDVLLKDNRGGHLLYIESKDIIRNESSWKKALAQVILTNRKQETPLTKVAIIYRDKNNVDHLELIDCSDDSIMYNNDINWKKEKCNSPSKDAIDRIFDRVKNHITEYKNDEIKEFYKKLISNQDSQIVITANNINYVYNEWKINVKFEEDIRDEQEMINLFLTDILKGTRYRKTIMRDVQETTLFGTITIGEEEVDLQEDLIREGTNLASYSLTPNTENVDGIKYRDVSTNRSNYYTIKDKNSYHHFWKTYKRPPVKEEFLKILEKSASLYTDQYRRDVGGEYTPTCFVELQNEILYQHYNMNDFIVFDPCAGVGNLENQFGKEYKSYCYLSTLESSDVDTMKIKGFENAVKFNYLENDNQPTFLYGGRELTVDEICRKENRKLMIVMNPPYKKEGRMNMAIKFFNKVLKLNPQVIVFYYMTESFLRDEIKYYIRSNYKIVSHVMSNAKTTFMLSEWPISQVIFDKDIGEPINPEAITVKRYELEKIERNTFEFKYEGDYTYNYSKPNLIDEIHKKIKEEGIGYTLGKWSNISSSQTLNIENISANFNDNPVTTHNLKYVLLSKGINFNTHNKYFERNQYMLKGTVDDVTDELWGDAVIMTLFYKNCAFTNKNPERPNYIMPFTAEELGCPRNTLNVYDYDTSHEIFEGETFISEHFDFREFMKQFTFSKEAKDVYNAALEIFKYYHRASKYTHKNWNDSFYDITNAIMGKDPQQFAVQEEREMGRIGRMRTTEGTQGFGEKTIGAVVPPEDIPIFKDFFAKRRLLAEKINQELLDAGILLWRRQNIF